MTDAPIMVRMDDDLRAKLDADRGTVNRSEWIRRLVEAHGQPIPPDMHPPPPVDLATPSGPDPRVNPPRKAKRRVTATGNVQDSITNCPHPVTRLIGDQCGLCGAIVKGPKR